MSDIIINEKADKLSPSDARCVAEEFVWATSEEGRLRALSVYIIRSIVERYQGTIEIDPAKDTISVNVPKEEQAVCAREIREQLGCFGVKQV